MYPKRLPNIIKPLAKDLVFENKTTTNELFLTFDDGPHPELTPWVMDQLEDFNAKGTFFLVGENALKYPELVAEITERGHAIGNHSYSHLNGWKTDSAAYKDDVMRCDEIVKSMMFRPPYGRITRKQAILLKDHFRIIMWSHLSADFDEKCSAQDCIRYATQKLKPGSIVVFHDSDKAKPRLLEALPQCLSFYVDHGYALTALTV